MEGRGMPICAFLQYDTIEECDRILFSYVYLKACPLHYIPGGSEPNCKQLCTRAQPGVCKCMRYEYGYAMIVRKRQLVCPD